MEKIKIIFLLCIFSSIFFNQIFCKLDKEKVVIAINCGGPDFTDSNGVDYIKVIKKFKKKNNKKIG
jgi:hypothetical protein